MGLKVREFRSLKDRRKYGAISAYWRIGALITEAAGTRADYGSDRLATVSGRLKRGFSKEMLQHCRRLRLLWTKQEATEADVAKLSFRSAVALLALDGLALRVTRHAAWLKAHRQSLVQQYGAGKFDAAGLLIAITEARLKVLHGSQSGARRKHLANSRRVLKSLLTHAADRLEADIELHARKLQPRVRKLVKVLQTALVKMERMYPKPIKSEA